jgi:sodium/proline symporter
VAVSISFFGFLLLFTAVGVYASSRKKETTADYLVASRSVSPWLTALSAVSSNNSGFMFIGLVGSVYTEGVSGAWLIIGFVLGDWFSWFFVHRRLRERSEVAQAETIPGFLGHGLKGQALVVGIAGFLVLAFLSVYASAQLNAGGKALAAFGIDPTLGTFMGAGIVLAYCVAGGIRASIWTDAVQSVVMFAAIVILLVVVVVELGGPGATLARLEAIDPALLEWFPAKTHGFALFMAGWIFAGFGVVGQPHVMIRAMSINSPESVGQARRIYMTWNALFAALCVCVGLLSRAYLSAPLPDPEMAFPLLSKAALPGVLVGTMLAGLFAAIISTADSQVLSCSAAITQDLLPSLEKNRFGARLVAQQKLHPYLTAKLGTLFVTILVLLAALFATEVFAKVLFAWSALAASLGPLMIVRVLGLKISGPAAAMMMISGISTVFVWIFVLEWNGVLYEAMPGMLAGAATYGIYRLISVRD